MGVANMPTAISKQAISRARNLRRSMTDGEKKLWGELRQFRRWYGVHTRRQVPIGPYVADFAIHDHKLVIEVDGEHHFTAKGKMMDKCRDAWFVEQGYRVLRFNTGELSESFGGCVEEILHALDLTEASNNTPTTHRSPPAGGEPGGAVGD